VGAEVSGRAWDPFEALDALSHLPSKHAVDHTGALVTYAQAKAAWEALGSPRVVFERPPPCAGFTVKRRTPPSPETPETKKP
jgi:hypothetical protein